MNKTRKATSFRLDPELLRAAQHYAIDHNTTVVKIVEQGLRLVLKLKEDRK
jgi:predicted transcriptional regulator